MIWRTFSDFLRFPSTGDALSSAGDMTDADTPASPSNPRLSSRDLARLLEQLHAATEHFSSARKHLEHAMDCSGYDCPNPEVAEDELRAAHRELESVTAKIHTMLSEKR